jgi:hypothetical protein
VSNDSLDPVVRRLLEDGVRAELLSASEVGAIRRPGSDIRAVVTRSLVPDARGRFRSRRSLFWIRLGASPKIIGQVRDVDLYQTIEILERAADLWSFEDAAHDGGAPR